jgi:hypothetical protein
MEAYHPAGHEWAPDAEMNNTGLKTKDTREWHFRHSDFGIVSDFGVRISDLNR